MMKEEGSSTTPSSAARISFRTDNGPFKSWFSWYIPGISFRSDNATFKGLGGEEPAKLADSIVERATCSQLINPDRAMKIQICDTPMVCHLLCAQLMKFASHAENTTPSTCRSAKAESRGTTHAANTLLRRWRAGVHVSVYAVMLDFSARIRQIGGLEIR
ncbi:hypothetical protein Cgig2_023801 [Carnegiea gigantea]|uniref:Uncharacterized protein n=1 Tax=Carnegiea gigantea TaxID=171969 RepID=A0A9Q1GHT2_9CARY|nr:hypothetical protein Cgig2_023801 [Carnegiea gigantea]